MAEQPPRILVVPAERHRRIAIVHRIPDAAHIGRIIGIGIVVAPGIETQEQPVARCELKIQLGVYVVEIIVRKIIAVEQRL
jgi:hypothetical protein